MIIRSFKRAREFAEFDSDTGSFSAFQKEDAEMEALQAQMQGRYEDLEDKLVVFYRKEGLLHLRVAANDYLLDDNIESQLEKHPADGLIQSSPESLRPFLSRLVGAHRKFSLSNNGTALLFLRYKSPIDSVSPFDFTMADDEDLDFLLFVHNVLSDPERRRGIWAST